MSVVVWDGKILAADCQCESGGFAEKVQKVFELKTGHLLAFTGAYAVALELKMWFENGAESENWPDCQKHDDFCRMIVVAPNGEVFVYEDRPIPIPIEAPTAWGAGRDYAMGAMEMGADARKAVEVASKHNIFCGLGVDAFEIGEP